MADKLVEIVYEGLCGEGGLLASLRMNRGLDRSQYETVTSALRALVERYRHEELVPKRLAAAFVDIGGDSAALLSPLEGTATYDEVESCLQELADLGRELFEPG